MPRRGDDCASVRRLQSKVTARRLFFWGANGHAAARIKVIRYRPGPRVAVTARFSPEALRGRGDCRLQRVHNPGGKLHSIRPRALLKPRRLAARGAVIEHQVTIKFLQELSYSSIPFSCSVLHAAEACALPARADCSRLSKCLRLHQPPRSACKHHFPYFNVGS